ncbi:MAG: addiction module antidote protein, HigA family [Bryobacterales bacterium]|nr:addiction module antidote protein, HigA family [Bryobacterales bacterium]
MAQKNKLLNPIHPGELLTEEFMQPLGISINRLSRDLHVPPNRIHGIVPGTRVLPPSLPLY